MGTILNLKAHDDESGKWLEACYVNNPCGCKIVGNGLLSAPLGIEYCPAHAAVNPANPAPETYMVIGRKADGTTKMFSKGLTLADALDELNTRREQISARGWQVFDLTPNTPLATTAPKIAGFRAYTFTEHTDYSVEQETA